MTTKRSNLGIQIKSVEPINYNKLFKKYQTKGAYSVMMKSYKRICTLSDSCNIKNHVQEIKIN